MRGAKRLRLKKNNIVPLYIVSSVLYNVYTKGAEGRGSIKKEN